MKENKKHSKIATIIKHEYITKVKSKGFILSTILGPIGLLLIIAVPILVTVLTGQDTEKKLAILDKTGVIGTELVDHDASKYFITTENEETLREKVLNGDLDGYLLIPSNIVEKGEATVVTLGGGGLGFLSSVSRIVSRTVRHQRLEESGASQELIKLVDSGVDIKTQKITETGTEKDYTEALTAVGYIMGFMIYMLMFFYGAFVMRGVIEEKANRIIEVIASSAKPFEIMMGKILGIGAVGLTQVLCWIALGAIAMLVGVPIIESFATPDPSTMQAAQQADLPLGFEIPYISPWIFAAFIFYFLAGYFIYSTLFAAVGSAVDQESDASQLQGPIMIPIILPMLFIGVIMNNPDGTLAIILSLIPFFSPILMIVRIAATQVPLWQVFTSMALMIGTFFACVWVASKIYRVGILMYGKKPSFKDLFKWIKIA